MLLVDNPFRPAAESDSATAMTANPNREPVLAARLRLAAESSTLVHRSTSWNAAAASAAAAVVFAGSAREIFWVASFEF